MNNTRFATVIHILTLLADNEGESLNSDFIAGSIQINPVIVRKELALLQDRGWVQTKKGKEGGSSLNISSTKISLADIYQFVKNADILGKKNLHTNPQCSIGNGINEKLQVVFDETDQLVIRSLKEKTLADFVGLFH